jgi:hypothetical protein
MILNLHLGRIAHRLHELPSGTLCFLAVVMLTSVHSSIRKPEIMLPPPAPPAAPSATTMPAISTLVSLTRSLHRAFLPHPLTILPLFSPKLRGIITTSFLGSYMSSISALNPLKLLSQVLGSSVKDTVERIDLPDGGIVTLVWTNSAPPATQEQPLILLLPGMNNSSETGFVRSLSLALSRSTPSHVATLDYRHVGHSQAFESSSSRPCCADSYKDMPLVIAHIQRLYKPSSLLLIGQSLGAGIGLKYLGTNPGCPVTAMVAVSPPVNYPDIASYVPTRACASDLDGLQGGGGETMCGRAHVRASSGVRLLCARSPASAAEGLAFLRAR